MPNVKILLVSHKPFKVPKGEYFVPIHAGRSIAMEKSKDGKIDKDDLDWMLKNTIGDDTGDNISDKNRYYSECSALYWAWKNYDALGNPDYIGLMHYRRHFIFNDEYYVNNIKDDWHDALCYKNEDFIDDKYIKNIGLTDENILKACSDYDLVVTKDTKFDLIGGYNIRENYKNIIPGVKVEDFDNMINKIVNKFPDYKSIFNKYLNGYNAANYQMFIMKKELFFEYCEFLFSILFDIGQEIDFEQYTTNGKRTLGYLAERMLSFFVWKKQEENLKILKLGVTEVEYPYEDETIEKIIDSGCPSVFEYLRLKLKSYFLKGEQKLANKEIYQGLRRRIKSYKKLKKLYNK